MGYGIVVTLMGGNRKGLEMPSAAQHMFPHLEKLCLGIWDDCNFQEIADKAVQEKQSEHLFKAEKMCEQMKLTCLPFRDEPVPNHPTFQEIEQHENFQSLKIVLDLYGDDLEWGY